MIISVDRVKLLAVITAIIVIPFIGVNLINHCLNKTSEPASKIIGETTGGDGLRVNNPLKTETSESTFLSEYRMERERMRSKELTLLQEISNNANSTQKAREAAYLKLVNLVDREEKEMQAEALIKSQGYQDCAVLVTESNNATVMVDSSDLTVSQQQGIAKAVGIITGGTEKTVSVIKLTPSGQ